MVKFGSLWKILGSYEKKTNRKEGFSKKKMKLIRRFSTTPPQMPRQVTITIPGPVARVYARYTKEFAAWKEEGPAHPFTRKMILGGALFGMCTGGALAAHHIRKDRYADGDRKDDLIFAMFMGTIIGTASGLAWPVAPAILTVYPIYKLFEIYSRGRRPL